MDTPRLLKHLAVLAFLGLQFGAPLHYYASDRVYDERFAWRMFSPIRMVRCQPRVLDHASDPPAEVKLSSEVAAPWISWMKRGHARVLRAAGRSMCEDRGPGARLTADLRCQLPDGTPDHVMRAEELCSDS